MNISAIISEYNPFHNGHLYHISRTREITKADAVICVMSGNFVQRGLPAIIDKWSRAQMALMNGVDLVIELPVIYSLSSAEFFAFGAVSLLNSLGSVNNLSFGSEEGSVENLLYIASILQKESDEYKDILKAFLKEGLSFPTARSKALEKIMLQLNNNCDVSSYKLAELLNSSNNILGIEYCKSLLSLNSTISPFTVKREGASYNSENLHSVFSSATSIRKSIKTFNYTQEIEKHVPPSVNKIISEIATSGNNFVFEDDMLSFIKYKHFACNCDIRALPDVSEGIENRVYKALLHELSYNDLITFIKSKRYTYSRISRILCQYFIGFEAFDTKILRKEPCPYARVLGFNSVGASILKQFKSSTSIPIYTKLPKQLNHTLHLDIQSTKAYSTLNKNVKPIDDFLKGPVIMK